MKVLITYPKGKQCLSKVTISSKDLWSLDVTLAKVIYPALKKFRKAYVSNEHIGYPCEFVIDNNKDFNDPVNVEKIKEWHLVMDKMVFAFECIAKYKELDNEDKIQEGLNLFSKYYQYLWI